MITMKSQQLVNDDILRTDNFGTDTALTETCPVFVPITITHLYNSRDKQTKAIGKKRIPKFHHRYFV